MDSAYVLHALLASGVNSGHPAIKKGIEYLVSRQSLIEGDWHYNSPHLEPGGWGFEHHNLWFPDIDCTAMVLDAFAQLDKPALQSIDKTVQSGINWIAGMQNRDGGFSAWDRNTLKPPQLMNYFFDMDWIYFDQSNEDITARAILSLSAFNYSKRKGNNGVIQRAIKLLKTKQDGEGMWYGRWLINYTYCTGQVLQGLIASGEDPSQTYIQNAVKWLKKVQNSDGGWGETPESYADPKYIGVGKSTALQTAYALIGLISAGETSSPQVLKGIEYLVKIQGTDGSWLDDEYLGTGVPIFFYCRYDLLPTPKALYALTLFLKELDK
jgi:squalene-hopene/tetraprenyl-beta-curcumene cyclase